LPEGADGEYQPHHDNRDKNAIPRQQAFVQGDDLSQYAGKAGQEDGYMQLDKRFVHR
jgi:hypothetical protein